MRRASPLSAALVAGCVATSLLSMAWVSPAFAAPPESPSSETGDPAPDAGLEPATDADEAAPEVDEAARKAAAKQEVVAAREAFSAGEFQQAIDHYEAANDLLPAAKLHYNIGVCHQRLALETEDATVRTRERELAVESYNRYLAKNPGAEDRRDVARTIRELNGTPITMPGLKPAFETEPGAPLPPEEPDPFDQADTEAAEAHQVPYPHHGRFGVLLLGGFSPNLSAAKAVDAPGLVAIEFHGGGFVGRRRRFLLAAETMLFTGATLRSDGFPFYGYSLGLIGQQTWVVGREAVQIGFGGLAALTGQGLNQREGVAPPLCSLQRGTGQIAGRSGAVFGARFDAGLLIGPRKRGMINLLVQPSVAVFGDGPRGDQCLADETPWSVLGVRPRWQFQLWAGAGFSFRF